MDNFLHLRVVTTCWFSMWFSVLCVYSVSAISQSRHESWKEKQVVKDFSLCQKVWWHCINRLIIPCVTHEPATGKSAVIMFITQASLVPVWFLHWARHYKAQLFLWRNHCGTSERSNGQGVLWKPSFPVRILEFKNLCYCLCNRGLRKMASQKRING